MPNNKTKFLPSSGPDIELIGAVLEITVSTVAALLAIVLAAFVVPRALMRLTKVLLLVISLSMVLSSFCTVCHVSISSFLNVNGTQVVPKATLLELRIVQTVGIQSKTIAFILLLLERLLFIVFPRFRKNYFLRSVVLSIITVLIIVGMAILFALSMISWNLLTLLNKIMLGPQLLVIPLCFFGHLSSQKLYKSQIASVSLHLRYEVSETVELTRVIFPICAIDSILSIIVIVCGFLMTAKTIDYKTYASIARWVATIQSLCATILILARHRLFTRRIRKVFGFKGREKSRKVNSLDKNHETDKYFEMVRKQW